MPGHDPRRRRFAPVEPPGGEGADLEERRAGIDEPVDPLARGQLAAASVPLERGGAASDGDGGAALAQLGDERLHPGGAAGELLRLRVHV